MMEAIMTGAILAVAEAVTDITEEVEEATDSSLGAATVTAGKLVVATYELPGNVDGHNNKNFSARKPPKTTITSAVITKTILPPKNLFMKTV